MSLFRQSYTKPIPPHAERLNHKGKPHVRFKNRRGKVILAQLSEDGTRCVVESSKWYGQYTDADDVQQRVPLSVNRTVAEQMLGELKRKAELGKVGIRDLYAEHRKRPLAEHLADFEQSLRAGGSGAKHVQHTAHSVRRILDGCRFVFMADLSASRVGTYLADLRRSPGERPALDPSKAEYRKRELAELLGIKPAAVTSLVKRHRLAATGSSKDRLFPKATAAALLSLRADGRSIRTSNFHLGAIKQFCRWLVQDKRMDDNPLAHLSVGNAKLDRRHDRRALPPAELQAVIQAAQKSSRGFRGLAGTDRALLYCVACASGFRAEEMACLTPDHFDLAGDLPTVTLGAVETKNDRTAVQPLPADVAEALRGYLAGRLGDRPIWPGKWFHRAADMLRIDLDVAGIPYAAPGPDGPLYADFHALRHSFIAMLDKSGATLKEAMQLARHSDPKLTMAVYGRAQLHDLAEAVRRLPGLLKAPATETPKHAAAAQTLAATGTDGADSTDPGSISYTTLTQTSDGTCLRLMAADGEQGAEGVKGIGRNPLDLQGVEADRGRLMVNEEGAPRRTRTYNPLIKSQLLCQLS